MSEIIMKELYQETIRETSLNVTQSMIDSIRTKNITKSGCRVYKDGFIGIAGTFGEASEETWKEAEKNLMKKIPYTYKPERNKSRVRDLSNKKLTTEEFIEKAEKLLQRLREEFPGFIYSNKIKLTEIEITLTNDAGLNYKSIDKIINLMLIVKKLGSVNIFDTGIVYMNRDFDIEAIYDEAKEELRAFDINVELPDNSSMPIVLGFSNISSKFTEALNGEMLGRKSSMFNNKIGEKVFHDDFTTYVDISEENYLSSFFDAEGSTLKDDMYCLIENGTIIGGYTDKKNAESFSIPNTACGAGEYDDVPSLKPPTLSVKPSGMNLKQLLHGKEAILIAMMSGGDWTNEGDFASPVQMSYLIKDGKILGKLPEFSISGNIYEMFGNEYIGLSTDKPYFSEKALVIHVKITK